MATNPRPTSVPSDPAGAALSALADARRATLALVEGLPAAAVEAVHSPLLSPLAWDLGHIAAFEDLWLAHRHGGLPLLRPDLLDTYDALETPRAARSETPHLGYADALEYLAEVRCRTESVTDQIGVGDGLRHEMVVRHELQHQETMLQALELAQLPALRAARPVPAPAAVRGHTGLEFVEVPGGPCTLGASPHGFAYDNERPRHGAKVPGFLIGRAPVTNATWLRFAEGGGYERREWWSDEGWSWKQDYDITRPEGWDGHGRARRITGLAPLEPDAPVVHVSWFEADAFARSVGARLPTEAEWEKAATWDHAAGAARCQPWGATPWTPQCANLGRERGGPVAAGALPAGAAPCGALGMLGDVWEWTASCFAGYPGFRAFPYKEYSEVFFGTAYRVLRGGSWASDARVATATFRNWDFPERRQIFAGVRLARDLS